MIGNLLVNTKGPGLQVVLDRSIKIPVAKGWAEEGGLPGSHRQGRRSKRKKGIYLALKGESPAM